ncbi:MAG: hypothetical protein Q9159_004327 [Coniocarpon cinnabarinum]
MVPVTYAVQHDNGQKGTPPPAFKHTAHLFAKYQWANAYLFFTTIWSVKASFLAYYFDLTTNLIGYRRAWWSITVFTALTYTGCLFAYAFLNGLQSGDQDHKNQAIRYQFSADFTTDVFITALPLTLAFKSAFKRKRKIELAAVFSSTLLITVFSIFRFAVNSPTLGVDPLTWIQAWSQIEQNILIIVACSVNYRIFLSGKLEKERRRYSAAEAGGDNSSTWRAFGKRKLRGTSDFSQLDSMDGHEGNDGHDDFINRPQVELLETIPKPTIHRQV